MQHEPSDALPPRPLGDSALQSHVLESVASAVNYHAWLTSLALPYLGDNPIELGSGLGDYAQAWLDAGTPRLTVTEIDPARLAHLKARFADDTRVEITAIDIADPAPAAHSALVAYNVLEHIPDDVGTLRAAHRVVRPGGHVVMFVPAFTFAMGRFDRQVGHVRRYTVTTLRRAMVDAGLEVRRAHYVNLPGLPAWVLGMRLLRMTPGDGPLLQAWDRHVIPRARAWEERHQPPFGQSVFAVAQVPEPTPGSPLGGS